MQENIPEKFVPPLKFRNHSHLAIVKIISSWLHPYNCFKAWALSIHFSGSAEFAQSEFACDECIYFLRGIFSFIIKPPWPLVTVCSFYLTDYIQVRFEKFVNWKVAVGSLGNFIKKKVFKVCVQNIIFEIMVLVIYV